MPWVPQAGGVQEKLERIVMRLKVTSVRVPDFAASTADKKNNIYKGITVVAQSLTETTVNAKGETKPKYYDIGVSIPKTDVIDYKMPEFAMLKRLDEMTYRKEQPICELVFYAKKVAGVDKITKQDRVFTNYRAGVNEIARWKII